MTKRERLQLLITGKTPKILEGFKAFDEGVSKLKADMEEAIRVSTLDEINGKISEFKKKMDFQPLFDSIKMLKEEIADRDEVSKQELEVKLAGLKKDLADSSNLSSNSIKDIGEEIDNIQTQLAEIYSRPAPEMPDFNKPIAESEKRVLNIINNLEKYDDAGIRKEIKKEIANLESGMKKIQTDLVSRISGIGGGSMNRDITVGGNASTLGKYTDINIKPGTGMVISYANNDTTKKVDITFTSTGTSVVGTVRSINTISTSQTLGAVASTDYVYICTAGINVTLPTAATNTNLYTIKNAGASSILVTTTGGETIDTQANIIMPIQYTSVDLISDTANWNIT